jgi:hypothetical protein
MFKAKPYVKVGKGGWTVIVPRPPKHATHAVLTMHNDLKENGSPKTATLPIQDFGCFKGVSGSFHYIRMDKKRKVHEEYKDTWKWDGKEVEGMEQLLEQ